MPIYEFRCHTCGRKTTALVLVRAEADKVACRHCGGRDLERLWSRFATPKSDEARLERLADSDTFADVDENDPASVARAMKRMAREMGEDFGDELDAALEESEREGEEPGEGTRSEDDF